MDDRLCVATWLLRQAAKCRVPVDDVTIVFLKEKGAKTPKVYTADEDAGCSHHRN